MPIIIKPMETDAEIRGKAFVHWKCWQETYPGMVSQAYLDALTLGKVEEKAFQWRDNLLVALDGERVVGFVGYGDHGAADPETGEIFALYVLPEYQGQGLGRRLMEVGLAKLAACSRIVLWVVKGNDRAVHFYEKYGFHLNGAEKLVSSIGAGGLQMVMEK